MKIELPPKYYLTHFRELRSVLEEHYGPFFETAHSEFFSAFDQLSEDAQCLYLRMLNRKGKFFSKEGLHYEEISSTASAIQELKETGFAAELHPEEVNECLDFLPKQKILEIMLEKSIPHKKSWSRDLLKENLTDVSILPSEVLNTILVQKKTAEIDYLLFLFFGKLQSNLSLYTLRDLGVRKASGRKAIKARFRSKEEATSHYFYEKLYHSENPDPDIAAWPDPLNNESAELRENVLLWMADNLKREGKLSEALDVLRFCKGHPGREKRVRLLYQLDKKEECLQELEVLLESPVSDLEYLFAEDFLARKFNKEKRSRLTETLRNARKIAIDESFFRSPEAGVQEHFKTFGIESFHLENYLWNSLFGLIFWEELFESDKSSLFNEFERAPSDIYGKKFFEMHEEEIQRKLSGLSDRESVLNKLAATISEKEGTLNGIFSWHESIFSNIKLLFENAGADSIRHILLHMSMDYVARSTGFPDLMLIENGKIKFAEIKAEGDSLKQQQLLQMIALQKAGFEVEILQVNYVYNPDQLYVVVDLETTGGMPPYHRITEIGAVKMRRGEVVEKFQTLINPERKISREIEALTGISNEMVKDAPTFSEVAESFQEFSKDAIFVAHNVSFDYGFLQSEFNRLEERFVRPYICTKAWMRKFYPGLPSYGLKNLTANFNIPLMTHHRALCDAEAAAGLLNLINEKRADASGKNS